MKMQLKIIEDKKIKYLESWQAQKDFKLLLETGWSEEKQKLVWASWLDHKATMLVHGKIDKMDIDELYFYNGYLDHYFIKTDILGNPLSMPTRGKTIFNKIKQEIFERLLELGAIKW